MNRISPPLRGLYWKEARQLIPLVLMLMGLSVFFVVMWSALDVTSPFGSMVGNFIPLTMPALFAAGVGAILVGQEKETRTLLWCSSLPIAPSQIATAKYVVAIIGLLLLWVCSLAIGGFAGIIGPVSSNWIPTLGPANTLYWFLHSVFVLCCGFYTTWKLKNTFASLVALIPIAAIPYLFAQSVYALFTGGRHVSLEESAGVLSVITSVCIIVFAILGYRAAMKHLSPTDAEQDACGPRKWLAAWRPATSVPIPDSPFRLSLSSLVWQSIHHNRITLLGLFTLMLCGTICFVLTTNSSIDGPYSGLLAIGTIMGFLGLSWLGVFVFSGDGSAARMRFLADRGVSPTLAWLGRQLIGLSVIATISLLYAVLSYLSFKSSLDDSAGGRTILSLVSLVSLVSFGFVVFAVYSVSQWASQLIRILAASAFAAPVLSLQAVAYAVVTLDTLETPWWIAAICAVIPMIATWAMMRRHMDNNLRWPVWATGIIVVCLLTVLPGVPFAIEVRSWPRISSDLRDQLRAEAMQIPVPKASPQEFSWGANASGSLGDVYTLTEQDALKYLDERDYTPEGLIAFGETDIHSVVPLKFDGDVFWRGLEAANYFKIKLLSNPEDKASLDVFGAWVKTYAVITKRLRLSDRWVDQEAADRVEIWLTEALSKPELSKFHDRDFAQIAISVISDQETRVASRRRAILASWRDDQLVQSKSHDIQDQNGFGGLRKDNWFLWYVGAKRDATMSFSIDSLVATALRFNELGANGEDTQAVRRELHHLMVEPTVKFEHGTYSGTRDFETYRESPFYSFPASHWFGPWESAAMKLKSNQHKGG